MDTMPNQNLNPMQPTQTQPPAFAGEQSGSKGNKIFIIIGLFLVIFLLSLAGAYFYLNNQQKAAIQPPAVYLPPAVTPTTVVTQEESELQSIDVGDVEKDLQDLQGDVNKL